MYSTTIQRVLTASTTILQLSKKGFQFFFCYKKCIQKSTKRFQVQMQRSDCLLPVFIPKQEKNINRQKIERIILSGDEIILIQKKRSAHERIKKAKLRINLARFLSTKKIIKIETMTLTWIHIKTKIKIIIALLFFFCV